MDALVHEHELECDVLVAGGGPAGVPCAIAAARSGARVILCQDRHVLGGNASSEVRMHIVGADASGHRGVELATETREGGIVEEIRLETAVRNPQRSPSMLDLILYEKCRAEPNLTLMLNTTVNGARVVNGAITHATAVRQSTEDRFTIRAQVFVDCTGDGRLGAEAGAPFRRGREGRDEFGESLAQPVADDKSLGSTLLFTARKHDRPMPFVAPPWARKFTEDDLRFRPHGKPGADRGLEYGYWWVEWGGTLDTIKDNERIRDDLMAIMLGVWDHIKNGPPGTRPGEDPHGAANWALEWFSFLPGKRESRRFIGQHILSESDLMRSRPFADAIAFGGWPIDTHPPLGVDAKDEHPCDQRSVPHAFDIPLRSCVSAGPRNLMFAGRNISATHIAFASTRVMATCAVMGQGVGVAAAEAVRRGIAPAELAIDNEAMRAIQQRLLREDCYLIGVRRDDPADVAPAAKVVASSFLPDGPPENVLSSQSRAVHGPRGAPPDRAAPSTHRWISDPSQPLPAWIELRWGTPIRPKLVQLIFDTGLHRVLTLSHSDGYVAMMKWGRPQPECVRDYDLSVSPADGKSLRTVHEERGNYLRLRRHVLDGSPIVALHVTVHATNGTPSARVCEIRVEV